MALLLINNNKIIYESIIEIEEKETVIENKQLVAQAGIYRFKIELHSLNYKGMELEQNIEFNVLASSDKRKVT